MKVLVLHPDGNVMGNILWPYSPTSEALTLLHAGAERFRERGYWVSFFPEGDGITFKREGAEYDCAQALVDLSESFDPIEVVEKDGPSGRVELTDLLDDDAQAAVRVKYLVPVDQLLLLESFSIGNTSFHAPLDGEEVDVERHRWGMALCDVPGADVQSGWAAEKKNNLCGTTDLLAYPLVEREIDVPAKIFHGRGSSVRGQEKFLNFVISDADLALNILRWALCSYRRLEYLPNKAGWVGDFAYAYIEPQFGPKKGELLSAKPNVLRVTNNWRGLEAQALSVDAAAPIADVLDGSWTLGLASSVKAAVRTFGQAYYLTEPEASFLSMLYATDALTGVGKLKGFRQRIWVAAVASKGNAELFEGILQSFIDLYSLRNHLVHQGQTFVELDREPRQVNQDMSRILRLCVEDIHNARYASTGELAAHVMERLSLPEFEDIARPHPLASRHHVKFPVREDRDLRAHLTQMA
ncbi:hypothetical protein [Rhodovibrio salinarum]|uniref:hypothetical protein n=1 Tax=Rhodovibrio salinarum TaxID=1087 RepID=UPI0012DCEFC8|nr:hypothetical protein [Rhodovibrio salinarum]